MAPALPPDAGRALRRAARSTGWLIVAGCCAGLLPAFFVFPVPRSIGVSLVIVAVLAMRRPADALLVLAALAPLAGAIHPLVAAPYNSEALLEAFVLTVLAASAARAAVRGAPLFTTPFDVVSASLIALALASCVALLPTALLRAGSVDWLRGLWDFAVRDYFLRPAPFIAIERTAVLVEGLALAVLVSRVIREPGRARQLSNMVVIGGAAAAALNLHRLIEIAMRRPPFLDSMVWALQSQRFNTQYGDLNAAGSYFAMVTILAWCQAGFRTSRARAHTAAVPLLGCALWISGSRMALVAALLSTATVTLLRTGRGIPVWFRSRIRLAGAAGVLVAAFGVLVFLLPVTRHGTFTYSLTTRLELFKTAIGMAADRPIFGVGPAQFYALFPRYASPELTQAFAEAVGHPVPRENAHNQFLQVLAELGSAGLLAFVMVLAVAMRMRGRLESWRVAVIAALTGFLLTSLAGHPLLTPVVACSFWIVVGLAASGRFPVADRVIRRLAWGLGTTLLLLAVTMPWRWDLERREADLTDVRVGMGAWERDSDGMRFQVATGGATLFVSRESPDVRIPLRSPDQPTRRVRIMLDGETATVVNVTPDRWLDVRLPLLPGARTPAFRRVDLVVEGSASGPTGPRADALMIGRAVERPR